MNYKDKEFLITGGTGSLGKALIKRLIKDRANITVLSRDEGKQAFLRQDFPEVKTYIGCVRDYRIRSYEMYVSIYRQSMSSS